MNNFGKLVTFGLISLPLVLLSCKGEVPSVTTASVTNISSSLATSGGTIVSEGSSQVIERGVCWATNSSPTILNERTINGGGEGTYISEMSNLSSMTNYFVRAYASNDAGTSYGNEETFTTASLGLEPNNQILADHTVVDKFDQIPQQYLDSVKKMLVAIPGISHSNGYQIGADLLELLDARFQALTYSSYPPPQKSPNYLRIGKWANVGEKEFYISSSFIDSNKELITSQFNDGNPFSVIGLGWCYTMTWVNAPGGTKDPVYNVRWAGSSEGGPNGSLRWGLDNEDKILTGNSICMDTYLEAIEHYIEFCKDKKYATKIIFTTGPVDGNDGSENGYQRELKHEYIRRYVAADESRILFDYADILCWNNSGIKYITNWNDGGTIRPHVNIHPDNLKDYDNSWNMIPSTDADSDHIGEVGAVRLAKAMWWMLARIAGWDGN